MPVKKIENIKQNLFLGIWQITESAEELKALYLPFFSAKEFKIKNEKKLREHYAALCILKKTVEHAKIKFEGVDFYSSGKPYLIHNSSLHISISHSYPYAAVALSHVPVGVDIEAYQNKLIRLIPKYLSKDESLQTGLNVSRLSMAWAIKEALYKIKGETVNDYAKDLKIEQYSFISGEKGLARITIKDKSISSHFISYLENDYVCALAEETQT